MHPDLRLPYLKQMLPHLYCSQKEFPLKQAVVGIFSHRLNTNMQKTSYSKLLHHSTVQAQQLLIRCNKYNPIDDVSNDVLINDVAEYAIKKILSNTHNGAIILLKK